MKPKIHKLQVTRRFVQVFAVLFLLAVPVTARYVNYLSARELDKKIEKWEGTLQGNTLAVFDGFFRSLPGGEKPRGDRIVRNRKEVLADAQKIRGGMWSLEIAGLSMTDPLAGAENIWASRTIKRILLVSLIIPLLLTIVLGRVFCSWICPMNLLLELSDKLRGLLRFLELPPHNVRFSRSTKYIALAAGLVITLIMSLPVLGAIHPPAVIGRELHELVSGVFDRAEEGRFGFRAAGLSWMSLLILGVVILEVSVSRRWWCRYICPGGALYNLLGAARLVRVRRTAEKCTGCAACTASCHKGLAPMCDRTGLDCDNCGSCISHCESGALNYSFPVKKGGDPPRTKGKTAMVVFMFFTMAAAASAHHILGIPHYAYNEQYPQTPILTYLVNAGPHQIKMTGYPGIPRPNEFCSYNVYIQRLDDKKPFDGPVTFSVIRNELVGKDPVIYGPVEARLDQAVYKFYPRFGSEANYTVRIDYEAEGAPWTIDLPVVVGQPGSPWTVLICIGVGLIVFLVVIRAVRIKRQRHGKALKKSAKIRTGEEIPETFAEGTQP